MQALSYENELDLHESVVSHEWFRTKTGFDTEAEGVSKMAYCLR